MNRQTRSKIGMDVGDLPMDIKTGLRAAAEHSFGAVEIPAGVGEITPKALSSSGRRHLRRLVDGLGLLFPSVAADFQGLRWTDPGTVQARVEQTCDVLELARDMRVPVVTASIGALTHPESGDVSGMAIEALQRVGACADARDMIFAIRPSHDSGERLVSILDAVGCPSLRICLDPAAMVMAGANPLASINHLIQHLALVHARDGTVGGAQRSGQETRLGEGDVDLPSVMAVLAAAEYREPYILRRTDSPSPLKDLADGRDVLTGLMPPG